MPSPVACPRCAATFECGVDTNSCWCREVTLSDTTRAAFAQYYEGCLCRDCLTALEAERPQPPTVRAFLAAQIRRKHS